MAMRAPDLLATRSRSLLPQKAEVLTVGYKINLLAPAAGDHSEAIGPSGSPAAP
jgi:hypothetical protein